MLRGYYEQTISLMMDEATFNKFVHYRQSILKAASFSFDQAVFGHGSPLTRNANSELFKRFKEKD